MVSSTFLCFLILFSSYRMSTGAGGGEDPPQTPGSSGSKNTRGPTKGLVSARAGVGTPGANVVRYDRRHMMFYQDIREQNPLIGTFSNRLGNLIKATFQAHANDWNEVEPQHVTAVMTAIHNEYRFVYEDPATGERVPADCIRNEIESTIIREMKRLRRNQKSKLSSRFFNKFCGKIELAREETPKGYTHEAWLKAIEVFNIPAHKV